MTQARRALQSHDLSGEGINSRSYTFLTTQEHGGPPRMTYQLNVGATSETTQTWKTIHTNHAPIHSNKADIKGWLWRPNDIRDIVLQVRKNPERTSPRKLVPSGDRNRARCVTGAHATASCRQRSNIEYNVFKYIIILVFFIRRSLRRVQTLLTLNNFITLQYF